MAEELTAHPVAETIPSMAAEEYEALKADIHTNGLQEPIVLYEGRILDGRNRYRVCRELGIEPRTRQWDGNGSPVAYVLSANLHRRHLSASQRAAIAAGIEPMLAAHAETRQKAQGERGKEGGRGKRKTLPERIPEGNRRDGEVRQQAARLVGTNPRYVQDAKTVQRTDPKLLDRVREGKITLPKAKQEVRRRQKEAELEAKARHANQSEKDPLPWEIRHGDCLTILPTITEKARLIFGDPPYNIGVDYGDGKKADKVPAKEYLDWCRQWISFCMGCLTEDGSLWVMINDQWADYFGIMLRKAGLHRRAWIKWYETFGVNCANNFNRCSRHIFYCVVDPKRFVFHAEAVSRLSDRQAKYKDKRADPGGKIWDDVWQIPRLTGTCAERIPGFPTQVPLAITRAIVGCASDPGDLVLDPFSGSASTGMAAVELGRRYLGIERSKKFCDLSQIRLRTAKER